MKIKKSYLPKNVTSLHSEERKTYGYARRIHYARHTEKQYSDQKTASSMTNEYFQSQPSIQNQQIETNPN